jgi:DNA helicase IV
VSDERWTRSDLPLLDELEFRINGGPPTYGHVVVDEAQDLSSMALRLIARRASAGSMTVVGDVAQATTPWAQERWEDAVAHLGDAGTARIEELGIGYRVPGPILDLANRLLAEAAPHVRPARSVRETGDPPRIVPAGDAAAAAAGEAVELADRFGSVAVIAPAALIVPIEYALTERGVPWADGARVGLGERVTLLDPAGAKGLEFDAVVVVEPAAVVAGEPAGARALFVAMTRAVQHLSVVHAEDLPPALR